jgi:hypothetical protein
MSEWRDGIYYTVVDPLAPDKEEKVSFAMASEGFSLVISAAPGEALRHVPPDVQETFPPEAKELFWQLAIDRQQLMELGFLLVAYARPDKWLDLESVDALFDGYGIHHDEMLSFAKTLRQLADVIEENCK